MRRLRQPTHLLLYLNRHTFACALTEADVGKVLALDGADLTVDGERRAAASALRHPWRPVT